MVSFFKDKSAAGVFGLVIVSAGIRAFFWRTPPQIVTSPGDGLIYYPLSYLSKVTAGIAVPLIYHLLVLIQALRLNYALNDFRMFPKPAFTTALAYVMLTALIPAWNNITSALVTNSMLIWLVYRMIRLHNTHQPKTLVYNIGLITGSTVLLYYPSFPLILVIFFALGTIRPFRPNEWVILLLGVITPFYFLAGWLFLDDKLKLFSGQLKMFYPHVVTPANLLFALITFGIATVGVITGIYLWQSNSNRMVIQVRKNWMILFTMLLVLVPPVFLIRNLWPDALLLATVPASAFVSNSFLYPKRNVYPPLLFWIFVALIIYNNWFIAKI